MGRNRLLRVSIDPESHAPTHATPLSSSTSSATASAFSAAQHMAQWETARLEAEARLSRDSLLFSPSFLNLNLTSARASSASAVIPANPNNADVKKEPADVFLRMWNSDIGSAFRKQTKQSRSLNNNNNCIAEEEFSCCNTKHSSALTVSKANNGAEKATEMTAGAVMSERREGVESSEVQQAEEMSDETYHFCLDLAAGDDDLSLFQNHHQLGMSCYSWFVNDLSGSIIHSSDD